MKWTDEQLEIVMKAASWADGGCVCCICDVLTNFCNLTEWKLLDRMDKIAKDEWFMGNTWKEVRPEKVDHEDDDE